MVVIPTSTDAHYKQVSSLDGTDFILEFKWNDREGRWYLSLYDQNESPILLGAKVVVNWPLLRKVSDTRRPRGELIAFDLSGSGESPGRDELGERVKLTFLTYAELSE